jgi:hypothetical protein
MSTLSLFVAFARGLSLWMIGIGPPRGCGHGLRGAGFMRGPNIATSQI